MGGIARMVLAAAILVAALGGARPRTAAPGFPSRLETYLANDVRLTSDERRQLLDGAPVTKLLDIDPSKEVAVFGAVWIAAPMASYVRAVNDIETFEHGKGFTITRRIAARPMLSDFAQLRLPQEDVTDLRSCRVGRCEVKLSEQALREFETAVDWNAADPAAAADLVMRRLMLEYVTGYLEGGNDRLAVYRDKSRPTFVAREFRDMIGRMPELTTYMPNVREYLLGFPKVALPASSSFLYWQETEFGLKPTIRISHVTIREGADDTVVTSKMLYASHYFWTGLELRALLRDPSRGSGFWFVTVNRSRSDGLSGFTGMFVRRRVQSEVQNGSLAALEGTRRLLEGTH